MALKEHHGDRDSWSEESTGEEEGEGRGRSWGLDESLKSDGGGGVRLALKPRPSVLVVLGIVQLVGRSLRGPVGAGLRH